MREEKVQQWLLFFSPFIYKKDFLFDVASRRI
jgi:hypothetical protein